MKAKYSFYGWEQAARLHATVDGYTGILTPLDLFDRLDRVWCAETCAPRLREKWTEDNNTLGQCSITAFLVQDIFGGEVFAMPTKSGGLHCYNRVDGVVFDLTDAQFGDTAESLVYDCSDLQDRESSNHFFKEEKRQRYLLLKSRLKEICG